MVSHVHRRGGPGPNAAGDCVDITPIGGAGHDTALRPDREGLSYARAATQLLAMDRRQDGLRWRTVTVLVPKLSSTDAHSDFTIDLNSDSAPRNDPGLKEGGTYLTGR